jgi:hypothetical protein
MEGPLKLWEKCKAGTLATRLEPARGKPKAIHGETPQIPPGRPRRRYQTIRRLLQTIWRLLQTIRRLLQMVRRLL